MDLQRMSQDPGFCPSGVFTCKLRQLEILSWSPKRRTLHRSDPLINLKHKEDNPRTSLSSLYCNLAPKEIPFSCKRSISNRNILYWLWQGAEGVNLDRQLLQRNLRSTVSHGETKAEVYKEHVWATLWISAKPRSDPSPWCTGSWEKENRGASVLWMTGRELIFWCGVLLILSSCHVQQK